MGESASPVMVSSAVVSVSDASMTPPFFVSPVTERVKFAKVQLVIVTFGDPDSSIAVDDVVRGADAAIWIEVSCNVPLEARKMGTVRRETEN